MGIEVTKKTTVKVDADRLWSILAEDFENVGQWASAVDHSAVNTKAPVLDGASIGGRVCQTPTFGAVNETFTKFDRADRSYAFKATASKIPSFVSNITSHAKVTPAGANQSELKVTITADTHGVRGALVKPMMTRNFAKTIDSLFADISVYAESGRVSAEKTKAIAKAAA